jgi:hypothetical protein
MSSTMTLFVTVTAIKWRNLMAPQRLTNGRW